MVSVPVELKSYDVLKSVEKDPVADGPLVKALMGARWDMSKDEGKLPLSLHFEQDIL